LLAFVVAVPTWAPSSSHTANAGSDPIAVAQALIDAANQSFPAGDPTAFVNKFTEDGVFTGQDDGFAIVGRTAMMFAFSQDGPDSNFHITLTSSQVDGNTVTGSLDVIDQDTVDAGVTRHIELFTAVVDGDLVASLSLAYDHDDPDTQTYLAYTASQDDGGNDQPPPGAVTIDLAGDQPGQATIFDADDGVAIVGLQIEPGAEGVLQPVHVHTGTCASPGPVVYPLASIVDGGSFTALSVSKADLLSHDYIVNVHLSPDAMGTYVSCAALQAPAPTSTARPAATATPGVVLPKTGTGGAGSESPWLAIALMTAGAAMLAGLGALRMARR
jgi:hypothetical protein